MQHIFLYGVCINKIVLSERAEITRHIFIGVPIYICIQEISDSSPRFLAVLTEVCVFCCLLEASSRTLQ